jgi:methylated-DNA-[protein]-cysteine S-methyltransferase
MSTYYCYHDSPIGPLLLAGDGEALSLLGFPEGKMRRQHEPGWLESPEKFRKVRKQLDDYFAGRLDRFDVPLAPKGTEFQETVWQALTEIPFGETWSYGELARRIGKPKASRAVGAANGVNPIPIIIPCHRVIGASGKLTGFGGGLLTKQYLLDLEARRSQPELALV